MVPTTNVFGPHVQRVRAGEVLPVPPELVGQIWKSVVSCFRSIPHYDVERLHTRLLMGQDKLWVAVQTAGVPQRLYTYMAVIVTTITARPPSQRKTFQRSDPAAMRSLTVHLAAGVSPRAWIDSAVERITRYGQEQLCRQLFLLTRKGWQAWTLQRFYSHGHWDTVAISRDRPTQAKGIFKARNRPGFYRPVVPISPREMRDQLYNNGSVCPLKEEV